MKGLYTRHGTFTAALMCTSLFLSPMYAESVKKAPPTLVEEIGKNTLKVFPALEERCYNTGFPRGGKLGSFQVSRSFTAPKGLERLNPSLEDAKANAKKWGMSGSFGVGKITATSYFYDTQKFYSQSLNCRDGAHGLIECRAECDAGGFNLKQTDETLIFKFDRPTGQRLVLSNGCGDDTDPDYASREITPALIKDGFVLTPSDPELCTEFEGYVVPKFAALRPLTSLRLAITEQKVNCLSHIALDPGFDPTRPKDAIDKVAISIKSQPKLNLDSEGFYTTSFDATVSLKRHDRSLAQENTVCTAGDYEVTCGNEFRLRRADEKTATLIVGTWNGQADEDRKLAGLHINKSSERLNLKFNELNKCEVK